MLAHYNVLAFISKHRNVEVTEALVYCCCACAQDEDSLKKIFQLFLKDVVLITCQTEKEPMRDEESRQTDLTHAFIEDCRSSLRLSFTQYRLETVLAGKTNGFCCLQTIEMTYNLVPLLVE